MKYERPIINISMFDSEKVAAEGQDILVTSGITNNVQQAQQYAVANSFQGVNAQKALVVIEFNK